MSNGVFNWEKHGIDISRVRGGKMQCPKCSSTRKDKRDPCLSVDKDKGVFNCHNCGFHGTAYEYPKKREYIKPLPRLEKVSKKTIDFFEGRGISNNTLLRFKITEAREWMPPPIDTECQVICFNYYRGQELVNIKFRGPQKTFKMSKDSELIVYNINDIAGEAEAIFVEGEMDCLSWHEAGIFNSVSVPNGASKGNQRLEYLDNCWKAFEGIKKIILATDNDEAGLALREELARRLGKERCWQVIYPEGCKDTNEVLMKYGKESVAAMRTNATPWPIEGIASMDEMFETIGDFYINGYPKGSKAGITSTSPGRGFDDHLSFLPGQLTIITGIPGSGKDEFANWLMARLAMLASWSWGVIQFEEPNEFTVTKLMEKMTDKSFDFRKDESHRINLTDFDRSIALVDKYFHFVKTDEVDVTVDGLIEKIEQMVRRFGINGVLINPWNYLEHKKKDGQSETEYVSESLTKIISCLKRNNLHGFLMAHPTKIKKDDKTGKYKIATLYDCSGSAHFFNKTHNGISVYRDFETNLVDVYIQKVKHSWLGKLGFCTFHFDPFTRKYTPAA